MTDLLLYTAILPQDSQAGLPARRQQQLATSGVLGQDGGVAELLSSEPGDQTVSGLFRGLYADLMADELEELAQASGFDELPLAGVGASTPTDGYYSIESADVDQVQPHTPLVQSYEIQFRKKGTKSDHWRALESKRHQLDHTFGNETTPVEVGVPAVATKVQWFNPDDGTRTPASSTATRSAELGSIGIYDLDAGESAVGTSNPTLLYEMPYTSEEDVDTRVYDTLGNAAKLDADGDLQWQKVFSTTHGFGAEVILDTGLLRLRLDEPNGTLEAEEWDDVNSTWTTVGLEADQPTSTTLWDVDLMDVAMVRDRAQLTFDVSGDLFALNAILNRGYDTVQFTIPKNETGPIPTDLENWLSPIASTSVVDPNPSKALVGRKEVRR